MGAQEPAGVFFRVCVGWFFFFSYTHIYLYFLMTRYQCFIGPAIFKAFMYELGDFWTFDVSLYILEVCACKFFFFFWFGWGVWWYPLRWNFDVARRLPNSPGDRRQWWGKKK